MYICKVIFVLFLGFLLVLVLVVVFCFKRYINMFKKASLFSIGCIIVGFIIYIRFILEREPREIPVKLTIYQMSSYILCCTFSFVMVCVIILSFSSFTGSKKGIIMFLQKQRLKVTNIIFESLRYVHEVIGELLPEYLRYILFLAKKLRPMFQKERNIAYLVGLFCVIPQILVCLFFAVDVFYYHKWDFFYKSLILLSLPLIFNTIHGIFRHTYDLSLAGISSVLCVILDDNNEQALGFKSREAMDWTYTHCKVKSLNEFIDSYYGPIDMLGPEIINPVDEFKAKYFRWLLLVTFSIYGCGWGYVIFNAINN